MLSRSRIARLLCFIQSVSLTLGSLRRWFFFLGPRSSRNMDYLRACLANAIPASLKPPTKEEKMKEEMKAIIGIFFNRVFGLTALGTLQWRRFLESVDSLTCSGV